MTGARWLAFAGSLGLHAAGLIMVAWLFGGERTEPALFIDLTVPAPSPVPSAPAAPGASAPRVRTSADDRPARPRGTPRAPDPPTAPRTAPAPEIVPPELAPRLREEPPRVVETPKPADLPPPPAVTPERLPSPAASPEATAIGPTGDSGSGSASTASGRGEGGSGGGPTAEGGATVATGRGGGGGAAGEPGGAGADGGRGPHADGGGRSPGAEGTAVARTAPGAGDSVDLGPYHEVLRRHIRDSLAYPAAVRRRGLRGTVEVDILVRADGAIRDVTLARSSSEPALDDAAIAALRRLPPVSFPPGLPPRALRVRVPVVFDLR